MTIKHIYPIADQMINGKRVTVDLVLEFDGHSAHPYLSQDKGASLHTCLMSAYDIEAIRALGFPVDGIVEDKRPLELAEVKEDA